MATSPATSAAINRILRKFSALDRVGGGIGDLGDHTHPKESIPTVLVAASDARDEILNMADLVCDGVEDDAEINGALDVLPSGGGRIILSAGTFEIDTNRLDLGRNTNQWVWLQGMGRATRVHTSNTTGAMICPGPDTRITDMEIAGSGTTEIGIGGSQFSAPLGIGGGGNRVIIERINFLNVVRSVFLSGNHWSISDCDTQGAGQFFVSPGALYIGTIITGNRGGGQIDVGQGTYWIISNNYRDSGIFGTNPHNLVIVGNTFNFPNVFNEAVIEIVADAGGSESEPTDMIIMGNQISEANGWTGILLDGLIHGVIADNQIGDAAFGVWAKNCDKIVVTGNLLQDMEIGIELLDTHESVVAGNNILRPVFLPDSDGIRVSGDRNHIHDNKVTPDSGGPGDTRHGIYIVSGFRNIVVGNELGLEADYTDLPLKNLGDATQLVYPNHPSWGDNFVDEGLEQEMTEAVGVTDTVTRDAPAERTISESVGVTDSVTATENGKIRSVFDPVGVADLVTPIKSITVAITDPVGVSGSTFIPISATVEISEATGVTDDAVDVLT